jgi:hypothetical protein
MELLFSLLPPNKTNYVAYTSQPADENDIAMKVIKTPVITDQ